MFEQMWKTMFTEHEQTYFSAVKANCFPQFLRLLQGLVSQYDIRA